MRVLLLIVFVFSLVSFFPAQSQKPGPVQAPSPPAPLNPAPDISGMYSFLHQGEFLQVTIEPEGAVSGFVARYGDSDSDKGTFLDHFFIQAGYDGHRLNFRTAMVHGVAYRFSGTVSRGRPADRSKEGYWMLTGTLTELRKSANGKTGTRSRAVEFKSLP